MRLRGSAPWLVLLAGCSITVDENAPDMTRVGEAPPVLGPRVRCDSVCEGASPVLGVDGTDWVAIPVRAPSRVQISRLQPPAGEELLTASTIQIARRALFLIDRGAEANAPDSLRIRRAGGGDTGPKIELPPGVTDIIVGGEGEVFVAWPSGSPEFEIRHADGSIARTLPVTTAFSNGPRLIGQFNDTGDIFFSEDHCGSTGSQADCGWVAHSTNAARDIPLGRLETPLNLDEQDRAVLSCDTKGLRLVPYDGSAARVLVPDCAAEPRSSWLLGRYAMFNVAGDLSSIPLDGSRPARVIFHRDIQHNLLAVGPEAVAYSHGGVISSSTDGWIGDWQFMERGSRVAFGDGYRRVRWLEHTARSPASGDLLSAPVAGGKALNLGHNVAQFEELADGRILAAADQPFVNRYNEVVAIDERKRVAQPLAEGGKWFRRIPGSNALLVELVVDDLHHELARVIIPPPMP